jgi:hypothetical protein
MKHNKVLEKIKLISSSWPKRKEFIEGAYKILLFTKTVKPEVAISMKILKQFDLFEFMDFDKIQRLVLHKHYESVAIATK